MFAIRKEKIDDGWRILVRPAKRAIGHPPAAWVHIGYALRQPDGLKSALGMKWIPRYTASPPGRFATVGEATGTIRKAADWLIHRYQIDLTSGEK